MALLDYNHNLVWFLYELLSQLWAGNADRYGGYDMDAYLYRPGHDDDSCSWLL